MAVTFRREVLTDGKAAIRVDGAPFSPAWFRVRLLEKDIIKTASNAPDELMIKAEAYQVDAAGVAIADSEGPTISRLITADALVLGAPAMTGEKQSIAKQAIRKAIGSLQDVGTVAQLPKELVE